MSTFLLVLLVGVSVGMLAWGARSRARAFQFPTLFGAAWLFYVAFQAVGVVSNPHCLPVGVVLDHGVELALFMSVLCASAGFIGYTRTRVPRPAPSECHQYSNGRVFAGGLLLLAVSWAGFYKLASLSGGTAAYFSTEGNYRLTWSGLPVAYEFFTRLVYPGLLLSLLSAARAPTPLKTVAVSLGLAYPLAKIVFLGRRTDIAVLALVITLACFFSRGWVPPRIVVIIGFVLGAGAIFVAPVYRNYSAIGGDRDQIKNIDVTGILASVWNGTEYSEFQYAVARIAATNKGGGYGYGRLFYNIAIQEWVPRQIVGEGLKNALFVSAPNAREEILSEYGWSPMYGSNPTGINQAFGEFSFFGASLYYLIGMGFKYAWVRATRDKDLACVVLYVAMSPWAMLSVIANVSQIPTTLIYVAIFIYPVARWARIPFRGGAQHTRRALCQS